MSEANLDVIWAIKNGDVEEVKSFVEKGMDVTKVEVAGRKAIHFAADCGQHDVLEFLIHMGAEINAPDKYGYTALLSAIYEGHVDCVKLLVSKSHSLLTVYHLLLPLVDLPCWWDRTYP